jgi:cyclopropane fatty-acyl-phospholipid synthase-like methyltransferase
MNLTDKNFWIKYWENKTNLNIKVKPNYILSEILKKITSKNKVKTAIELGGYPGYYAIYLKKYLNIESTLLDYVVIKKQIESLLKINELNVNSVKLIEADLFNYDIKTKYDLVLSVGLIEHFENTSEIIKMHTDFLNEKGVLFINIPNFKGLNGLIQKYFDLENYKKHNIDCMNIEKLHSICKQLGLKNIEVRYYGSFMIWLENFDEKSFFFKKAFNIIWLFFKVIFKLIPIETRFFSPYINITATK